jgi:mono/diheme cytochrome c family protein
MHLSWRVRVKMKDIGSRRRFTTAASAILSVTLLGGASPSLAAQRPLAAVQSERSAGGRIYDKWCRDCHTADGPGSRALQRKYQGALPADLEQRNNLPPEFVKLVVRRGMSFMPTFRKTEISDAELALVAAYLMPPPAK